MKLAIYAAIFSVLVVEVIRSEEYACTGDSQVVTGTTVFDIDQFQSRGYKCDPGTKWASGEVVQVIRCVGDVWTPLTSECVTNDVAVVPCDNPTLPANSQRIEETRWPEDRNFAAFQCNSAFEWFSGQKTVVTQCVLNVWQTVYDICDTECNFPQHCGDIFELGFKEDSLYKILPSGDSADSPTTVRCGLAENSANLGGSWTKIFKLCSSTMDSAIQSKTAFINGFGDPELKTYYFIGLQPLADISEALKDEKMILSIEFWLDTELKYHASYSDFSIGASPTFALNSIGKFHGNAGDALCQHVHASFDFGDETDNARWWAPLDTLEQVKQTKGSFLTKLVWATLIADVSNFDCVTMRIRPASFESDKYCPPAIGYEPSWTTTKIAAFPVDRAPGTEISFVCEDETGLHKAADSAGNNKMSAGIITCSNNFEWTPNIIFPCTILCPDGYIVSPDEKKCLHFSTALATRVGAIYECMASGATLADATVGTYMGMAADTNYRWVAETSRKTGFADTELFPSGDLSTAFTCAAPEVCSPTLPNQCTSVAKGKTYKHLNCEEKLPYICQLPGICPAEFLQMAGGCYKKLSDTFTHETGLKACNAEFSGLAWLTSLSGTNMMVKEADFQSPFPKKFLIGNNKADGTWTNGGMYPEMDDGLSALMLKEDPALYRSMVINEDRSFTFIAETETDSLSLPVICQFHGPIGCASPPPTENLVNMYLSYDMERGVSDIAEKATYICFAGYFFGRVIGEVTKEVTCKGQLGNWGEAMTETCEKIPLCTTDGITVPNGMTPIEDENSLYLNGTIKYNCPSNKGYLDGSATITTTCVQDSTTKEYKFSITEIPECIVCTEVLTFSEADHHFNAAPYNLGPYTAAIPSLGLQCIDHYEHAFKDNSQEIMCTETGWDKTPIKPCYPVCPPALSFLMESQLTSADLEKNAVDDVVIYNCPENMFVTPVANGETKQSSITITCLRTHQWDKTPLATSMCEASLCTEDPPNPPINGEWSWIASPPIRTQDTKVIYTCASGFLFPNGGATMEVMCDGGKWMPAINVADFVCTQPSCTTDPPGAPMHGERLWDPIVHFQGTKVSYTCHSGFFFPSRVTTIEVTCEGDQWMPPTAPEEVVCTEDVVACTGNPPSVPANGKSSWDTTLGSRSLGTTAIYTCNSGYSFPNLVPTIEVICQGPEWVPAMTTADLLCTQAPCTTDPASAPSHGERVWEINARSHGTKATYTCDSTYRFPDDVATKEVTCEGGQWIPPTTADFTCKQYCDIDPPQPLPESLIITEQYTTTEVTTILNYTCHPGLYIEPTEADGKIVNHFLVTCDVSQKWIPAVIDSTLQCKGLCVDAPPEIPANSKREWDNSQAVGTKIVYTCDTDYTFGDQSSTWTLSCDGQAWLPYDASKFACTAFCLETPPEPVADTNFVATTPESSEVGFAYNIYCADNMYIKPKAINQDITNKVTVTCNSNRKWEHWDFSKLECNMLCLDDPPPKSDNGKTSWDNIARNKDYSITYGCNDGYLFGNMESTYSITCDGSAWTTVDSSVFKCSKVCTEQPPSDIGGATHQYTATVGKLNEIVTYTCPTGSSNYLTLETTKEIECRITGWTEVTDFKCEKTCPGYPPEPPSNANHTFTDDIREGVAVSYFCEGEFENLNTTDFVISCTDGVWTPAVLPTCLNVTVVIPTLNPPPDAELYAQTTYYYQDNIFEFETDSGEKLEKTKSVIPLDDGVLLNGEKLECAFKRDFFPENEVCANQPSMCAEDGFSYSIWARIKDEPQSTKKRYLMSTGGDIDGSPGVSIYQEGNYLKSVVSTGSYYWSVAAWHHTPSDQWTVVSFRWREDIGLDMHMLNRTDGTMTKLSERRIPIKVVAKEGLDPPMLLLGCHATGEVPTHRDFFSGALDALAMWRGVVYDMKWFPGGFRVDTRNLDDIIKLLPVVPKTPDNIDSLLSEALTAQKEAALVKEEVSPTSTEEIISSSSEVQSKIPVVVDTEGHDSTIAILMELTKMEGCPTSALKKSDINGYQKTVSLFSNLLSKSDDNKVAWEKLYKKDPKNEPLRMALKSLDFNECILQRVPIEDGESFEKIIIKENVLMVSAKKLMSELESNTNDFVIPSRSMKTNDVWNDVARVAVSPYIYNDNRCKNRSISVTVQEYNSISFLHVLVVNEVYLNGNDKLVIDSVIMAARVRVDPKYFTDGTIDSSQPHCDVGNQGGYPIQLWIPHENKVKAVLSIRKLLFFTEPSRSKVIQRYCARFHKSLGKEGLWSIDDCRLVYSIKDGTRCICKRDGVFAIVARTRNIIHVENEPHWLHVTKYILYGISTFLLVIYIVVVSISGDLKDQFHMSGLNLSVAVICGSIGMIASDFDYVRDEQDICGAISSIIFYFYLSAGTWMVAIGHSCFKAITAGVINGKLQGYFFMAWGSSLAALGLIYMFFLHDIGTDPRCFVGWENDVKVTLLGPQIILGCVAIFFSLIVFCNLSTPALRKDNLIQEYGSFCRGAALIMIAFGATWICGFLAYMRLGLEQPDFYPIFTVLNASMGILIFICIGLGSSRFRTYITGQANARREMLRKQTFKFSVRKRTVHNVPAINNRPRLH